ncbi:hypothetical protein [Methanothrix sp.]|uniref:hypothetical protein n=1 Tax=Methanothrix sp. TaxID=90426 RepID=UPI003C793D79
MESYLNLATKSKKRRLISKKKVSKKRYQKRGIKKEALIKKRHQCHPTIEPREYGI